MSSDYKISVTRIPEAILQVVGYKVQDQVEKYVIAYTLKHFHFRYLRET